MSGEVTPPSTAAGGAKALGHAALVGALLVPMRLPPLCDALLRASSALNRRRPHSRAAQTVAYHVGAAVTRLDRAAPGRVRLATLAGGVRLATRAGDSLWLQQLVSGVWEPETTAFLRSWLRLGDTFLDIGANNGYFTCLAARAVGTGGAVHAFEPDPRSFALLTASVAANDFGRTVTCHRVAIGDVDGATLTLHLPADPRDSGRSSLIRHDWLGEGDRLDVAVWSLDGFLERFPLARVRLIKLDIEGGEAAALRGGERFFARARPEAVICEVWAEDFSPGTAAAVIERFERLGYRPWRLSAAGTPVRFDGRLRPGTTENLCFLPRGRGAAAAPVTAAARGQG